LQLLSNKLTHSNFLVKTGPQNFPYSSLNDLSDFNALAKQIHKISQGKNGFVKTEMSIELLKCIFSNCTFTPFDRTTIIDQIFEQCKSSMKFNPLPLTNTEF